MTSPRVIPSSRWVRIRSSAICSRTEAGRFLSFQRAASKVVDGRNQKYATEAVPTRILREITAMWNFLPIGNSVVSIASSDGHKAHRVGLTS